MSSSSNNPTIDDANSTISTISGQYKLKHCSSLPVKNRKEAMNPLLFRNSRSNIYEGAEVDVDEEDQGEGNHEQGEGGGDNEQRQDGNSGNGSNGSGIIRSRARKRNSIKLNKNNKNIQTWKINESKIDEISPFFQIQRTHTIINVGNNVNNNSNSYNNNNNNNTSTPAPVSASEIATNISNYLNRISVSTLYDNENAIAHAELENDLRILIRLFQKADKVDEAGTSTSSDGNRKILVEVSRREGCSAQYHSAAMKILRAAEGRDVDGDNGDDDANDNDNDGKNVVKSGLKAREAKVPAELRSKFLKQVKIV